MKRYPLILLALVFVYAISGCSKGAAPPPTGVAAVEDQASLVVAFQAAGAIAKVGDSITQDFFTPEGHIIMVNEQEVQVFEYENADAMESEASHIAPDGGSIGTSMMMWVDKPHFYKAGRILVLYIGNDTKILELLGKVIGPQFAGQ